LYWRFFAGRLEPLASSGAIHPTNREGEKLESWTWQNLDVGWYILWQRRRKTRKLDQTKLYQAWMWADTSHPQRRRKIRGLDLTEFYAAWMWADSSHSQIRRKTRELDLTEFYAAWMYADTSYPSYPLYLKERMLLIKK
jgi:hypothetical protein